MFSLNLASDGRILSAGYPRYQPHAPRVPGLPEGDISEYIYRDGEFIHSPLPLPPPGETADLESRLSSLEKSLELLTGSVGLLQKGMEQLKLSSTERNLI